MAAFSRGAIITTHTHTHTQTVLTFELEPSMAFAIFLLLTQIHLAHLHTVGFLHSDTDPCRTLVSRLGNDINIAHRHNLCPGLG